MRYRAKVISVAIGMASIAPAFAADLPTTKPAPAPIPEPVIPSTWRFEASIDGWAPSLNVGMGIRTLPVLPASANIFKLLPHLEGYVPVSFAAYNDNFIVGASLFWVRLGVDGTFGPGALGGVNAGLTINETSAAAYGGVRLPTASDWRVYATLGARYFGVNGSLNLQAPVVGFSRSASQGRDWVDPIVGLKARHRIDDKWFIDFEANAGGYHGSAAALGFGAIGYKWNQSLETSLGYRLFYEYYQGAAESGNGSFRFQQYLYGPQFTTTYTF
jgi:hypothetical protein